MSSYVGNDNYGRPKQEFLDKLKTLSDEELIKQAEQVIWLSAFANNNPRSDHHWQADACYDEAKSRQRPDLYESAYRKAYKSAIGSDPYPDELEDD